jgi:hypothetical protein
MWFKTLGCNDDRKINVLTIWESRGCDEQREKRKQFLSYPLVSAETWERRMADAGSSTINGCPIYFNLALNLIRDNFLPLFHGNLRKIVQPTLQKQVFLFGKLYSHVVP